MERFYLVIINLFICFSLFSCKVENNKIDKSQIEKEDKEIVYNWSIDDEFKKYVDSLNVSFKSHSTNLPDFIGNYNIEIKNRFKSSFALHHDNESRKEKVYYEIFNRCEKDGLLFIKNIVSKKTDVSEHDSFIIKAIDEVLKVK